MRPPAGPEPSPDATAGPWHLITGEYPPQLGGVSDYASLVAGGLARRGVEVHVWAPAIDDAAADDLIGGVAVHRAADRWSARGLAALDAALDAFPAPRRLLVQYAPNSWGARGMNVGFARWLARRARQGDALTTMFHELWYHPEPRDKFIRRVLPPVQKWMARHIARASRNVHISTLRWDELLRPRLGPDGPPIAWLPVPSNLPVVDDPAAVAELRAELAPRGETLLATFGTFHGVIAEPLLEAYPLALDAPGPPTRAVLIGRGSRAFVDQLLARRPDLITRVVAAGGLEPERASIHLQACDLMLQPYPEGVTTRRTTLMACLAHGRAVLTSLGPLTEPVWRESGAVALTPAGDPAALALRAVELVADPAARARLAAAATPLYDARFSIEQTLAALAGEPRPVASTEAETEAASRPLMSPTP